MSQDDPHHRSQLRARRRDGPAVRRPRLRPRAVRPADRPARGAQGRDPRPAPGPAGRDQALDVNDHDQVFEVFRDFHKEFGHLDRIVVNAGLGKGAPLGTGKFYANKETAETNFIGALAQTEAAAEIFREQDAGHFVMVSVVSALRGMPGNITTYAATKAAVAHLAEGLRVGPARDADEGDGALPRLHRVRDERRREDPAHGDAPRRASARWSPPSRRRRPPPGCPVAVGAARPGAQAHAALARPTLHVSR